MQKAWRIGERLTFSNQVPRSVYLRILGQVRLCGCLFIAFRGQSRIKGLYVICILFEDTLLLATCEEDSPTRYDTLAGIPLKSAMIEDCRHSHGLRCSTTPHAWKLVFGKNGRSYELIFVACSAEESSIWQANMTSAIERIAQDITTCRRAPLELHSPLLNDMQPLRDNSARNLSLQRPNADHFVTSAILPPTICEVRITNTQAIKDFPEAPSQTSLQLLRSYSTATTTHVPTLTPRRAQRQRLEKILDDVWTKDVLPYPGMIRRTTDPIRASANHVMRKFSMASITSNFSATKRSLSYTSIGSWRKEDVIPGKALTSSKSGSDDGVTKNSNKSSRTHRPPLVNFHSTPDAFLPVDFELEDPMITKRKKSALRTLTASFERPCSPLVSGTNRQSIYNQPKLIHEYPSKSPAPRLVSEALSNREEAGLEASGIPRRDSPVHPTQTHFESMHPTKDDKMKRKKGKNRLLSLFG